jgi:hypothetical protein
MPPVAYLFYVLLNDEIVAYTDAAYAYAAAMPYQTFLENALPIPSAYPYMIDTIAIYKPYSLLFSPITVPKFPNYDCKSRTAFCAYCSLSTKSSTCLFRARCYFACKSLFMSFKKDGLLMLGTPPPAPSYDTIGAPSFIAATSASYVCFNSFSLPSSNRHWINDVYLLRSSFTLDIFSLIDTNTGFIDMALKSPKAGFFVISLMVFSMPFNSSLYCLSK